MSGHYEINKPESREAEQVVDDSNDAGRVEGLHDDQKYKNYKDKVKGIKNRAKTTLKPCELVEPTTKQTDRRTKNMSETI